MIRISFGPRDLCCHAAKESIEVGRKTGPNCSKNREWGKGLEGKGHGSDKGPITVPLGVSGRSGSHPLRLVSTSYEFPVSCHGRGRGFEPRRPRHTLQMTYGAYGPKVTTKSGHNKLLNLHFEPVFLNQLCPRPSLLFPRSRPSSLQPCSVRLACSSSPAFQNPRPSAAGGGASWWRSALPDGTAAFRRSATDENLHRPMLAKYKRDWVSPRRRAVSASREWSC